MGFLPNFIARRPHVAEHDFTGIIANANGTELENGQAVYGFVPVRQCEVNLLLNTTYLLAQCRAQAEDEARITGSVSSRPRLSLCSSTFYPYSDPGSRIDTLRPHCVSSTIQHSQVRTWPKLIYQRRKHCCWHICDTVGKGHRMHCYRICIRKEGGLCQIIRCR